MLIEDTFLKEIKIKSTSHQPIQIYVVLRKNHDEFVGKVMKIQTNHVHNDIRQQQNVKFEQADQISLVLWDYDTHQLLKTIRMSTQKMLRYKYAKVIVSGFQIHVLCQSKSQAFSKNKNSLQNIPFPQDRQFNQKFNDNSQGSFKKQKYQLKSRIKQKPTRKKFQKPYDTGKAHMNSHNNFQRANSLENQASQMQTSLQKRILNQTNRMNYKIKIKSHEEELLYGLIQNRRLYKFDTVPHLYDDYQTYTGVKEVEQQKCSNKLNAHQSTQKHKIPSNLSLCADSTTSTWLVKKNLKSAIKYLTENNLTGFKTQRLSENKKSVQKQNKMRKINQELREISKQIHKQFNSAQFLSYNQIQPILTNPQRKCKKGKDSLQNAENISTQAIYERGLSRKQIQKVQKMNSFELSRSIFQQYGIDLSLNHIKQSKSLQKTNYQHINKQRIQIQVHQKKSNKKQTNNSLKILNFKDDDQNINRFRDYGQPSFQHSGHEVQINRIKKQKVYSKQKFVK